VVVQISIGSYEIINAADLICVFAVQIGVTRCGSGGRCLPRSSRGAMASTVGLVASLVEVIETELRPIVKVVRRLAKYARAIVLLAMVVVTSASQPITARRMWVPSWNIVIFVLFVTSMGCHPVMRSLGRLLLDKLVTGG
jgi:hypothetical protein